MRVTSGVAAVDAASGMVNQIHGTMSTVRTMRPPSISTLPRMGFGRNPGWAATQHFSEEEIAQWYPAGVNAKKLKGKHAAEELIKMKLHDPGDKDIRPLAINTRVHTRVYTGAHARARIPRTRAAHTLRLTVTDTITHGHRR